MSHLNLYFPTSHMDLVLVLQAHRNRKERIRLERMAADETERQKVLDSAVTLAVYHIVARSSLSAMRAGVNRMCACSSAYQITRFHLPPKVVYSVLYTRVTCMAGAYGPAQQSTYVHHVGATCTPVHKRIHRLPWDRRAGRSE